MSLYKLIKDEFENKGFVEVPNLVERLTASVGAHIFNLNNIELKKFYHAGGIENFRIHVVLMAPSGFGKSTPFRIILDDIYGILSEANFPTSVESGTFSSESWMGTIDKNGSGDMTTHEGVFSRYKTGIVGADDFMKLKSLMDGTGLTNEEVYLLTALDSDTAKKNLAYGQIVETGIGTTMWCGIRPCSLNMVSGLARRFSFQLFFPSPTIARCFKYAMRDKRMKSRVTSNTKEKIKDEVIKIEEKIREIDEIDYTPVEKWINGNMMIPHFEEIIYKRLAVGYTLASKDTFEIEIDEILESLFIDEFRNRMIIRESPEREMVYEIIKAEKKIDVKSLISFLSFWYQIPQLQAKGLILSLRRDDRVIVDGNYLIATRRRFVSKDKKTGKYKFKK